jgi:hypothetical protein
MVFDRVPSRRRLLPGFLLAVLLSSLSACAKKHADADDDLPIRPAATSASSAGPNRPASAPAVALPSIAPRNVDEGRTSDGRLWLPKYEIRRDDGDQNATVLAAWSACATRGMGLCTESQWDRACSVDSALGALETWTVTFSGQNGFVVRGGQGGCSARKVAPGSETSPSRAGVCCDPAVAISSENQNKGFLMTVADKMTRYERGIEKKSGAALAPFIDDTIGFFAKTYSHDQMVSKYDAWFRQWPDQWTVYDVCDVTIHPGVEATWTGDCTTTAAKGGEVAFVTTRYTWSGTGKVQRIEEVKVHRKFGAP